MELILQEIGHQYIATPQGLEQVYQNKLVEGQDFERFEWLKGDGLAWIDTGIIVSFSDTVGIYLKKQSLYPRQYYLSTRRANDGVVPYNHGLYLYTYQSNYNLSYRRGTWGGAAVLNDRQPTNQEIFFESTRNEYKYNNTVETQDTTDNGYESSLVLCYDKYYNMGGVCDIKEVYVNSISLTPCKLLAPCPPNLSANGKAYPIGECGMIDAISGKFYGNSGSGSFSVYNDPTK